MISLAERPDELVSWGQRKLKIERDEALRPLAPGDGTN